MKIGIPGTGRMGAAIAERLLSVGHQVTVWNRSADKTKALLEKGAKVAATPAALASGSEMIITILSDGEAIDAVYRGPQGLLAGDCKGKLFIEMSTVRPEVERALAADVRVGLKAVGAGRAVRGSVAAFRDSVRRALSEEDLDAQITLLEPLLEHLRHVVVLVDELLVSPAQLLERPQGGCDPSRVGDASDLEVVGRGEGGVAQHTEALGVGAGRLLPRVG